MTFKKPKMDKTLRNGLSMIETDPLKQMVGFRDLVGTGIASVSKKKLLLRVNEGLTTAAAAVAMMLIWKITNETFRF